MPRNGSDGTFTRLYDWTDDRDNSIKILASRMDDEMDGIATALTNSVAKDGQTTMTAALPMGGQKITGLGNATARTDGLAAGQLQDAGPVYVSATGSANAFLATYTPAITTYTAGLSLKFKANHDITGATTIDVNSIGAKTIKRFNSEDLVSGDITNGQIVEITYDGTNFQICSPPTAGAVSQAGILGMQIFLRYAI